VKFFIALIFSFLSVASYSQCDTVHNLTISSIGTQSAVISATPSSGSTSFIVYYYPQNDTSKAKYIIGNSPNFTITGLTPNTAYITFMGNWCGPTTIKSQKGKYLFTTAGITQSTNKFLIHNGFGDEYGVLKARKGFILPKADTLAAPLETGEIRYDTASQVNYQWTGEMWQPLAAGGDFTLGYDTNFIKAPLNVLSINTRGLNGYNGHINFKDFGAIGNGVYNTSGDLNALASGTYNDNALNTVFSRQADGGVSKQGGVELTLPVGAYRTHARLGGFNISSHNNILRGQGVGNTILHFERSSDLNESAITFGKSSGDADTRLLRGGGLSGLTLKSDNGHIINDGLVIDYAEYQTYENLNIEGFYRSAIKMGLWESRFNNITIRATGAGQTATNGVPDYGVIDFDSHSSSNPYRDACNNTTFDKITLSGLYGTHIRASTIANTIVNIKINGLYDETYHGDGGGVDTLPIYYFNAVRKFDINGGFLTVNETGVNRDRYAVVISNDTRNEKVTFTNFSFNQNISTPTPIYAQNATRDLKSFFYLSGANARLVLNNCTIFDPSGSVGKGLTTRYLIDGTDSSQVQLNDVVFEVKDGVWNLSNLINPKINAKGKITIRYYNDNRPTGVEETYNLPLERLSVKEFGGAVGDGITDDRGAIQRTFNAAYALGLDVDMGVGNYKITAPITLTEFTNTTRKRWPKIYGHGKGIDNGGTRIVAKNIPAFHGALEFLGDSNGWVTSAEVSNLEINTEDASNSDSSFCLFVGDARNFEASRLILRGKNNLLLRCGSYAGGQSTYSMINTVFSQVDFFSTSSKGWAVAHEGFFNGTIAPAGYDNIQFKNCLFSGLVNLNAHTGSIDACLFAVSPFKDSTTYTTGVLHGLTVNFSTALWISSGQHVSVTNCYFEDYKTAILVQPIDGAVVAATIDRNYFNGITNYPNPDSVNASYPNNYFFADYGVRVKAHPTGGGEVTKVTVSNSTFRDGAGINNHTFNRYPISNEGATKMYVSRSGVYYPNIPLRINGTYIGDPEAAVPPDIQTVLNNGNIATNNLHMKDGAAVRFYDGTTFRGMLVNPVGNVAGSRYMGLYNNSADFLGLISENKTSMQIGTVAHIVLDTAGVHLDNLNTTTTATEEVVLQGGILKRQIINNNPLGNIKVLPDANYTILSTDKVLILNEPTSARTITLPAASTLPNKEITLIVKTTTSGRWILAGSFIQQPGASITEDFINSGLNAITYRLASDGNKWYQE
jgi:hypothetical protein